MKAQAPTTAPAEVVVVKTKPTTTAATTSSASTVVVSKEQPTEVVVTTTTTPVVEISTDKLDSSGTADLELAKQLAIANAEKATLEADLGAL